MRYTDKRGCWVEFAGCADLPMREYDKLSGEVAEAQEVIKGVVTAWHFTDKSGADVALHDFGGLSLKQWLWLRGKFIDAARDEALDPEA